MLNGIISRNKRGVRLHSLGAVLALACFAMAATAQTASPSPEGPKQDYLVYVVCESADKIVLLRFGPKGLQIENQARTGLMPMDINGPHGIAVSPDKQYFYVSEGHGRPEGSVWKYRAGSNDVIKYTSLGMFPATTDITPDGSFIYVANANFHGDMVPSSISVVATDQMIEVKRITTCTMPHGSRLNHSGTRQYSACMMDDMLVEIDASKFAVSRYFMLAPGKEMGNIPTKLKVVHGAVISPDDRYAFISVEGVGTEPGTVEVIDLASLKTVATVDVGPQAAGIDFWKMEPSKP